MKKLYLFLALVLAMVGFGVSNALIATAEGGPQEAEDLEDGMEVFIGNNITNENGTLNEETGEYSHTFGNYRCLNDDVTKDNLAQAQGINQLFEGIKTTHIWTLVEGEATADGQLFYLKNSQTGRFIGRPERLKTDANGNIAATELPMVEAKAEAAAFLFLSPAEAWTLMGVQLSEANKDAAEDLLQTLNEDEDWNPLMIVTEVDGEYVALNCAGGVNRLTKWSDWAGWWNVVGAECTYDPITEFEQYMATVTIPSYQYGDYPGCVVEEQDARATITRLNELKSYIDDPDAWDESDFEGFLEEAKTLVAKLETFTFRPMVAGYYRFISAMGAFEEQQEVKKAMFAENGAAKWGTLNEGEEIMVDVTEEVTDPETGETTTEVVGQQGTGEYGGMNQIWVVEEKDGHFYVKNLKTQQYINNAVSQSAAVSMTNTEKWVEFTLLVNGDFSLKVEGKNYDLHTGGHASGAGVSGNIVGWNGNSGSGSAWIMQPVTEDEIKEIWGENAIANAAIEAEFMQVLAEAKALLETSQNSAKPTCEIIDPVIDRDNMIFTTADNDGTHVTSPCSDQTEGNIDNLLDGIEGDANNFWHSDWHGTYNGTWCNGYHYVQFDLKQGYQKLALYYVPRVRPAGNNNTFEGWPEEFTVYYTNTPDNEESWKRGVSFGEGEIDADLHELRQNYLPFYIAESARYVRVVCTKGYSWRNGNKFWMAGEMNFCTYEADVIYDDGFRTFDKANEQGNGCGDALVAAVAHADEVVENKTISQAELDALKAALEAFKANYTDFTKLSQLVADARNLLKAFPEGGTNPGQKPQNAIDALRAAQVAAADWLAANKRTCTKAQLTEQEGKMEAAIETFNAVPVAGINTNTWYYLQFASQRTGQESAGELADVELQHSRLAAMFGDDAELESMGESAIVVDTDAEGHDVYANTNYAGAVVLDPETKEYVEHNDYAAQWRFVEVQGLYAVQNRLTGNFFPVVDASNYTSNVSLSPMPGAFFVRYVKDGYFEIGSNNGNYNPESGTPNGYLNLYGQNGRMGYWQQTGETDLGARWNIVIAESIAADHVQDVWVGVDGVRPNGLVLPYDITLPESSSSVVFYDKVTGYDKTQGIVAIEEATGTTIPAGTPFIAYYDGNAIDATAHAVVQMASGIAQSYQVHAEGALQGTMAKNEILPAGVTVFAADNEKEYGALSVILNSDGKHIDAGKAWVNLAVVEERTVANNETILTVLGDASRVEDGVAPVTTATRNNAVYNLNGQRVNTPARGLYIVNGRKVVVR